MKKTLRRAVPFVVFVLAIRIFNPQPSQAINIGRALDNVIKRAICKALVLNMDECNPNPRINPPLAPTQVETEGFGNSQDSSTQPIAPNNDGRENLQNSPTQPEYLPTESQ